MVTGSMGLCVTVTAFWLGLYQVWRDDQNLIQASGSVFRYLWASLTK